MSIAVNHITPRPEKFRICLSYLHRQRWLQIVYFIGPYHPSMVKRNLIALHFDFVRIGKRLTSDLQPFELQNLFTPNSHLMNFVRTSSPGHFRVPKNLTFKTRLQWCKTFLLKMSFTCMRINNHFDINRLSLCLTFKQRLKATRECYRLTPYTSLPYVSIRAKAVSKIFIVNCIFP